MALTNLQIREAVEDSIMRNRTEASMMKAIGIIIDGNDNTDPPWDQTNRDNRLQWALFSLDNLVPESRKMWIVLLGVFGETVNSIDDLHAAPDSTLDNQVFKMVDDLANARAARVV